MEDWLRRLLLAVVSTGRLAILFGSATGVGALGGPSKDMALLTVGRNAVG